MKPFPQRSKEGNAGETIAQCVALVGVHDHDVPRFQRRRFEKGRALGVGPSGPVTSEHRGAYHHERRKEPPENEPPVREKAQSKRLDDGLAEYQQLRS